MVAGIAGAGIAGDSLAAVPATVSTAEAQSSWATVARLAGGVPVGSGNGGHPNWRSISPGPSYPFAVSRKMTSEKLSPGPRSERSRRQPPEEAKALAFVVGYRLDVAR